MRALSHFGNERLAVWSFRSGRAFRRRQDAERMSDMGLDDQRG